MMSGHPMRVFRAAVLLGGSDDELAEALERMIPCPIEGLTAKDVFAQLSKAMNEEIR